MDILDLLMREDLTQFRTSSAGNAWRGGPSPPEDLVQYLQDVRKHCLNRRFSPPNSGLSEQKSTIEHHIAVGMKVKKVHEVDNFARYVDRLTSDIAVAQKREITHLVDFGSGQNYLGRALAAQPYSKHIIAVESKQHNIEGAKDMDIKAKLVEKPKIMRNKKAYRAALQNGTDANQQCNLDGCTELPEMINTSKHNPVDAENLSNSDKDEVVDNAKTITTTFQLYTDGHGSVQYVEHRIKDSELGPVIEQIIDTSQIQQDKPKEEHVVEETNNPQLLPKSSEPNLMVISLHSCGNLVHHGLRSLLLNPSVSAVAMVGCCYNLVTERLGPPTYKLPTLRSSHPRLTSTSSAFDPHGFPMSDRLATYPLPQIPAPDANRKHTPDPATGLRLNITSRMMAVQAPQNWGRDDSELFFTRHFYRALLQRIFLDRGVVSALADDDDIVGSSVSAAGHTSKVNWAPPDGSGSGTGTGGGTTPLTIGTLRRFCYSDFVSYVRGALGKLTSPNSPCAVDPAFIAEKMGALTDAEIVDYEERYKKGKKELSVMWSLMAFSAGVVEAVIVVDRWLWLKEQEQIESAWVEPVFEYAMSPRNLVVVGIKKQNRGIPNLSPYI